VGEIDDAQRSENESQADSAEGEVPGRDQTVERRLSDRDGSAEDYESDGNDNERHGEPNRNRRVRWPQSQTLNAFNRARDFDRVTQRRQLA
jgi:hypothetical protein